MLQEQQTVIHESQDLVTELDNESMTRNIYRRNKNVPVIKRFILHE